MKWLPAVGTRQQHPFPETALTEQLFSLEFLSPIATIFRLAVNEPMSRITAAPPSSTLLRPLMAINRLKRQPLLPILGLGPGPGLGLLLEYVANDSVTTVVTKVTSANPNPSTPNEPPNDQPTNSSNPVKKVCLGPRSPQPLQVAPLRKPAYLKVRPQCLCSYEQATLVP